MLCRLQRPVAVVRAAARPTSGTQSTQLFSRHLVSCLQFLFGAQAAPQAAISNCAAVGWLLFPTPCFGRLCVTFFYVRSVSELDL